MVERLTQQMIAYFGSDVKRINHALKVYSFAKTIAELEKLSPDKKLIVEATAILHDIGIKEAEKKYNSSAGNYQEIEGPAIAQLFLEKAQFSQQQIERICFIIGHHHTLSKIDDSDFQILVEADFLVNFYEDELSPKAIQFAVTTYFKTLSGKQIANQMYS